MSLLFKLALIFCLLVFVLMPTFSLAQGYQPLAPIAGYTDTGGGANSLSDYLNGIFRLGLAVATGLAVVMIVIGGIKYMSTDSITGSTEGRKKINSALWGLLLALVSWLILNTINPQLLNSSFSLGQSGGNASGANGQQVGGIQVAEHWVDSNGIEYNVYNNGSLSITSGGTTTYYDSSGNPISHP